MESRQEMSCRSETKDREEIDVKEEFYEISTDGVNYRKIPEKYQTITPSPVQMCCRLCALPNDDMVDIFAADDAEHDMRDKMEYCLRIVVKESDNRPIQICSSCSDELELCYQFNKIVEEAERQFRASEEEHSTESPHDNLVVSDGPDTTERSFRDKTNHKPKKVLREPCEKLLIAPSDLKRHVRNLKKRDYRCSACGKSFKHLSTLKMHMTAHSGVRLWECDHCKKRFKTKGHLQKHLIVRTCKKRLEAKRRVYKCRTCATSFEQLSTLKMHITAHSDVRLWECDHCKKRFKTKGHLQKHLTVGTCKKRLEDKRRICKFKARASYYCRSKSILSKSTNLKIIGKKYIF